MTHGQCDMPDLYGYLPSCRESSPFLLVPNYTAMVSEAHRSPVPMPLIQEGKYPYKGQNDRKVTRITITCNSVIISCNSQSQRIVIYSIVLYYIILPDAILHRSLEFKHYTYKIITVTSQTYKNKLDSTLALEQHTKIHNVQYTK